jgi:hypothetical protein
MTPPTPIPASPTEAGTPDKALDFSTWKQQREAADAPLTGQEENADATAETASEAVPDDDRPQPDSEENTEELEAPKAEKPKKLTAVQQAIKWRQEYRKAQEQLKEVSSVHEENQRLREQLERQFRQPTPPEAKEEKSPERPKRPKFEEFPSVEAWTIADEEWLQKSMGWEFQQYEKARVAKEQQQREQSERDKIVQHWNKVSARAEDEYPGFKASIEALERKGYVTPAVASTIVMLSQDNEKGAVELARALIADPKTAQRLAQLPHYQVPLELGRILHTISSPSPPVKTEVSANHKPALSATTVLNGSGPSTTKLEDAQDYAQYARLRDKKEAARRRR